MFFYRRPLGDEIQIRSRIYHETSQKVNKLYYKLKLDALLVWGAAKYTARYVCHPFTLAGG